MPGLRLATPEDKLGFVLRVFILTFGTIVLFMLFFASQFAGLEDPNAMDMAQIARNVARAKGFCTNFLRPLSLALYPHAGPHPELGFQPLHPLATAVLFILGGATDKMAGLASGIPFLLCAPLVYFYARRLFGSGAALVALVLYATSVVLLQVSISGQEVSLLGLLLTAMFGTLYLAYERPRSERLWVGVSGVLAGLCVLTKDLYIVAFVIAVSFLWLTIPKRKWQAIGILTAAFIITTSPWLVRNWHLTGDPFFSLRKWELVMMTDTFPGQQAYREFERPYLTPTQFIVSKPRDLIKKAQRNLTLLTGYVQNLPNPFILAFFLAAILHRFPDRAFEKLRQSIYLGVALLVAGLCLLTPRYQLLLPFVPSIIVISTGYFMYLYDNRLPPDIRGPARRRRRRLRRLVMGAYIFASVYPLLVVFFTGPAQLMLPMKDVLHVFERTPCTRVATDIPWAVSWHADKEAVWVPTMMEELDRIAKVAPIDGVLLSPQMGLPGRDSPQLRNAYDMVRWAVTRVRLTEAAQPGERRMTWQQVARSVPAVLEEASKGLGRKLEPLPGFRLKELLGPAGDWQYYEKLPDEAD